jgi:hypothetical protein
MSHTCHTCKHPMSMEETYDSDLCAECQKAIIDGPCLAQEALEMVDCA